MNKIPKKQGAVALISILIISAITLILVISMSEINISTSKQYQNSSSNKETYYLAEACFEEALIRIEDDVSFAGTSITFDANSNCTIAVSPGGPSELVIDISINHYDYSQTYEGEITYAQNGEAINTHLSNWEEI